MADKKAKILKAYGIDDSKSKGKSSSKRKKASNNVPTLIDHNEEIIAQPIQESTQDENDSIEESKAEPQTAHLPDLEEEKHEESPNDNVEEQEDDENKNAPPQIDTTQKEGKAVKDMTPIEYFWAHQKSAAENRAKEKKGASRKGKKGKAKKADLFKAQSVPVSAPLPKYSPKNGMEESKGKGSMISDPEINPVKSKTSKK